MTIAINVFITIFVLVFLGGAFCVFFDQAILTRKGTVYRVRTPHKKIALTFDDGPSPEWTPKILKALSKAGIKATFFMVGHHVYNYPQIARQVADEGHEIGNHGYAHSVILYYNSAEIEEEIKYTEKVIKDITGHTTNSFRPPKAWLRKSIKDKIHSMGYNIVLWSLNSKDWVNFKHQFIVNYLAKRVKSGDILLFHDSGNVFSTEGGDRSQTVSAIPLLVKKLENMGFEFVTVKELLDTKDENIQV